MAASHGELVLPHDYEPRGYQIPFWEYMQNGGRRALLVWHRRSGKDKSTLNFTITAMAKQVGIYYYFFPTFQQGRKILWDGIDRDGPLLHHFPPEWIANRNETEMKITAPNGSIFQIVGTDKYDHIRGTNPVGCVFSEFSEQDPGAWKVVSPILGENGGWAIFCSTPKGKNHLYRLYEAASGLKSWFTQILTIDQTGVFRQSDVDAEIALGMDPDFAAQEYYCSFFGALAGSYFGKLMQDAQLSGRITRVPYEPLLLVHTSWDLGVDDETVIWFYQRHRSEARFIDYLEGRGEGLPTYVKALRDRPYIYGRHKAPHDIQVKELGTGKTRLESARSLGVIFDVVAKQSIEDGIQAARNLIPLSWFDKEKCAHGIDALSQYRRERSEVLQTYLRTPLHDWASHGADAYKIAALGMHTTDDTRDLRPRNAEMSFDPLTYEHSGRRGRGRDAETDFDPFGY